MKRKNILLFLLLSASTLWGQQKISLPKNFQQSFPRTLTDDNSKESLLKEIETKELSRQTFYNIKERVDKYLRMTEKDSSWLFSRLQMNWKTHYTDVFIKSEIFAYAGGKQAPAPTVRYTGARATTTIYGRPKLEDILPFMDDERGLWLPNASKAGNPFEWAEQAKSGRIIESINREVMGIARDAAFVYWITRDEKYAKLASGVFDAYMTGIYYRNVPVDLNHGHQQTLVGYSSFEVIHEDIITELVPLYDFLHDYLIKHKSEKMQVYATAFKKWADNLIDHGVPHNNWDLFKSNFILQIAMILDDDQNYSDKKGRQYYIDYVLNKSSIRQWSLPRLMDYGFDKNTGIWAECPGYSMGVVGDFANFISWYDRNFKIDLLSQFPIISKAAKSLPQYFFPNGNIVGFGDTHPGHVNIDLFERMTENAQRYGKRDQEILFTGLLKLIDPEYDVIKGSAKLSRAAVSSFFQNKHLVLDSTIKAASYTDFVSQTFWAPNVSWFVQRNGMDKNNSLMISENASEGNHMHANGISMELYGKGYTLGPDMGIGSGYFESDYAEYYSQFPAHNTVCVNGISSYPVMKSNHAFELRSCFPSPGATIDKEKTISYSDVYFKEPESGADQTRTMSIVTTGKHSGYYVDIFRSKVGADKDKMHDYFYHNLGQEMKIYNYAGDTLQLTPTEELAFAGAHLYSYSYLFNKKSMVTNQNIKTVFTMKIPDGNDIYMNMWMKGEKNREIFSASSPMCEGLSRDPKIPYKVKDQPTLTFVARQSGEAWSKPFVSVYEPCDKKEGSNIDSISYFNSDNNVTDFVGIKVVSKSGRVDHIFSATMDSAPVKYQNMQSQATYSVISENSNGDCTLFLGNGKLLINKDLVIESEQPANVILEKKNGLWYYTSDQPIRLRISARTFNVGISNYKPLK